MQGKEVRMEEADKYLLPVACTYVTNTLRRTAGEALASSVDFANRAAPVLSGALPLQRWPRACPARPALLLSLSRSAAKREEW